MKYAKKVMISVRMFLVLFLFIVAAMLTKSVAQTILSNEKASGIDSSRVAQPAQDVSLESPFGFHPASVAKPGYNNNGYGDASKIGVKWTRDGVYAYWFLVQPDLTKQDYDFTQYDRQWSRVPAGMNILANIAPQGPIDEGYCKLNSYLPIDEDKYRAFVKAVVQRYGSNSYAAAGLAAPIKYWQVGNEPNNTKKGFAELQRITYTAIKEVCPDCTVLIGGVPGMPPADQYIKNFDQFYKSILDTLGGKYVDVMDFHWYGNATGDYRGAKDVYEHIRNVLNNDGFPVIPFWIAEMGAYSGDPVPAPISNPPFDYPLQTERQQAVDYFKRFVYPLSFGVKKIFPAFGLMEGFKYDGGYFDFTGLIYDGWGPGDLGLGIKKLSYYTYQKMTEVLEGSDWGNIEAIQESNGIYVYKFMKQRTPVWVVWNDSGVTRTVTISGITTNQVKATDAVPKFESGKDVTDYTTAFQTDTLDVANGIVTLTLGDRPVFVESLIASSVGYDAENIPNEFVMHQNYPNPFNPTTTIRFSLPEPEHVLLKVFDVLGREVATLIDSKLNPGEHLVVYNAKGLPSGVYVYRLSAGTFVQPKKMVVLR
jgi:hypothetical protein